MIKQVFSEYLLEFYYRNRRRRTGFNEVERMINFLMTHNFLNGLTIKHFTVIAEFEAMSKEKSFKNKTQIIKAISQKYGLHENTIWNIVKDHSHKFGELF